MSKGIFIVFEGPDGGGKTTQTHLLQERLTRLGLKVLVTREPGGTRIGELIRKVVLAGDLPEMATITEILLMAADRGQHVEEIIRPALRDRVVICDRYVDSSIVYQGYAGGGDIETITRVNELATGGLRPNCTVFLDIDVENGLRRKAYQQDPKSDRFEQRTLEFHDRVRQGYLELVRHSADRFMRVAVANRTAQDVADEIWNRLTVRFPGLKEGN